MPTEYMKWTPAEQKQIDRFFAGAINTITLAAKIQEINRERTYDAIMGKVRREKRNGRLARKDAVTKQLRVGYLDIEANHLNADFGFMLSYCIKAAGKNEYCEGVVTKDEIFNYEFDKRLVTQLLEDFKKFDVLYAHYGADGRFDIPFIRTRAFDHGLQDKLPGRMELFIMDTWPTARRKLKLHSNRLGSIADALGIKNVKKTPLTPQIWRLASAGHPESLSYIALHNRRDVQILERVHKGLECVELKVYRSI